MKPICAWLILGVSNGGNCRMSSIQFTILPVPEIFKNDVECFRRAEYTGEEGVAIKVSPNGVPGIVFQHNNGRSALEQIITHSGRTAYPPPFFLYGPGTEPSVMHDKEDRLLRCTVFSSRTPSRHSFKPVAIV